MSIVGAGRAAAVAGRSIVVDGSAALRHIHVVGPLWRTAAAIVAVIGGAGQGVPLEGEGLWRLLEGGGHVIVMRHASTEPGLGDPPGFRLGKCATQRNLSEAGRGEARRLGDALRARGIPIGRVLSSRWCRCIETARLAFGRAEAWSELDSFFEERSREPHQTAAVRRLIADRPADGNLVLVTHQVNVMALTGISLAAGEFVVLTPREDGTFTVTGRQGPERE